MKGWTVACVGLCALLIVGDGTCDSACLNELCAFDDEECAVPVCNFDLGFCVLAIQGTCYAGCFPSILGDGECQAACWVQTCGFDGEECGCSPSYLASKTGLCEVACFASKCEFNNFDKLMVFVTLPLSVLLSIGSL